jgi:hypothetical protein
VDVAVKIQGTQWILGALERHVLYDQQIEAVRDGVEIWTEVQRDSRGNLLGFEASQSGETRKEVVRVLKRGETFRGSASIAKERPSNSSLAALMGGSVKNPKVLQVSALGKDGEDILYGKVLAADVRVTYVPKNADYINKYFAGLPTFDWEPE